MANAIEVSDSRSNGPEQIEEAAKAIGIGDKRKVFEAIYFHKAKVKTVAHIAKATRLTRMRVLQAGRHLHTKGIVRQTRKDDDTAYEKIDFIHGHKKKILGLAGNKKKIAAFPTKRKISTAALPKTIAIPTAAAKIKRVTIDDFQSFSKVKKIRKPATLSADISEDQFKQGVQRIIGELAKFKDWGGETSDLYSGRIRMKGKRYAVAFAFKGPGLKAKLVQGKMGKNGDQAARLFQEDADVFFVQHWREIDASVVSLMQALAVARSVATGNTIYYGIIDGQDSERLRAAYPDKFVSKAKRPKGKKAMRKR